MEEAAIGGDYPCPRCGEMIDSSTPRTECPHCGVNLSSKPSAQSGIPKVQEVPPEGNSMISDLKTVRNYVCQAVSVVKDEHGAYDAIFRLCEKMGFLDLPQIKELANGFPIILYFGTEQEKNDFVSAIQALHPNLQSQPVPPNP